MTAWCSDRKLLFKLCINTLLYIPKCRITLIILLISNSILQRISRNYPQSLASTSTLHQHPLQYSHSRHWLDSSTTSQYHNQWVWAITSCRVSHPVLCRILANASGYTELPQSCAFLTSANLSAATTSGATFDNIVLKSIVRGRHVAWNWSWQHTKAMRSARFAPKSRPRRAVSKKSRIVWFDGRGRTEKVASTRSKRQRIRFGSWVKRSRISNGNVPRINMLCER